MKLGKTFITTLSAAVLTVGALGPVTAAYNTTDSLQTQMRAQAERMQQRAQDQMARAEQRMAAQRDASKRHAKALRDHAKALAEWRNPIGT